mmetsp:Transcript_24180/g.28145  ORF Transcript_24180/g.28145 Transcript_24180/m.28145 type:complete len:221 (-) Transcript_24180:56-718(-)
MFVYSALVFPSSGAMGSRRVSPLLANVCRAGRSTGITLSSSLSSVSRWQGDVDTNGSMPFSLNERRRSFSAAPFAPSSSLLMRKFRGGKRTPRKRDAQEGDWLCACGETNYRSKRECFKCGAPAPPLPPGVRRPSLPGEDPKDWACPCGQMNFRGSVVCYRCKQAKPAPPPEPGQEITMWKCGKCSSINRNTRKFCFKCFSPCPLTAAVDTTSSSMGSHE